MHTNIIDSIRNRRVVTFDYDGLPRVVEPHAFGLSRKSKNLLRAYQTHGSSHSDNNLGWRLFTVDKIRNLNISSNVFATPRPEYQRDDSAMAIIHCQI